MSVSGDRIREFRVKLHLTMDDVAKRLGVGRQAIYKYEQGTVTNIPLENLEEMASMFGTTPGYLAGWTNEPEILAHEDLTPDEHQLVTIYRSLSAEGKKQVLYQAHVAQLAFGEKSSPVPASGSDAV